MDRQPSNLSRPNLNLSPTDNPLLEGQVLPAFSRIQPEHVEPAVDQILAENRARLEALLAKDAQTWDALVSPLEIMDTHLNRTWAPVGHLYAVASTDALRKVYHACLPKLSAYATELGQNTALYDAYRAIAEGPEFERLNRAQQKVITDALKDFQLSGVALPEAQKQRFKAIQQALTQAGAQFEENLLDATQAWHKHVTDPKVLTGLPESALALARQYAQQKDLEGWLITLEFPAYHAVMTFADDHSLREEVYTAHNTRASDQGPFALRWDNSPVMAEILTLRQEAARLLGFANYAEQSLSTKMAQSPKQALTFLRELARRACPKAEQEWAELCEFAQAHLGLDALKSWDIAYVSEKLRQHRFTLSEEDLKPYFPVDAVLKGLFELVSRLFGVVAHEIEEVDTWHPDVRFFELRDVHGTVRGQFYLDLYARPNKRGGAWMDEYVTRIRSAAGLQVPVAFLTCNAAPPVAGNPALFTHDEVLTLFHEFGHGLHHLLTLIDYPSVAGINGVEWDAVELPSQFMENWGWVREALDLFARHYATGEPLPETLYEKLDASRHFHSALQMLRQIEFALFDLKLYLEYDPAQDGTSSGQRIQAILDAVRDEVSVIHPPEFVRFQHGFSHIFAGGYAAGYYSYKWAEVLSADAYSAFEEAAPPALNAEVGARFLHAILEQGGSAPAMTLFKNFRGREPQIDALLRHSGLAA